MAEEKLFFIVSSSLDGAPVRDHLLHGFESRRDFEAALRNLVSRWHGRVGECIDERHGFLLLRFHDTPGGKPDEEWLPRYLLQPADVPEYMMEADNPDDVTRELDEAFGFD